MPRFFPCQLPDGSTYVVDGRTNTVVQTIDRNPDTAARWAQAKRACAARNKAEAQRNRTAVQRNRLGCLVLACLPVLVDVFTGGGLSSWIVRAISSAL
jgi:hypothetical protein